MSENHAETGFWARLKRAEDKVLPPRSPRRMLFYMGMAALLAAGVGDHFINRGSDQVVNGIKPTISQKGDELNQNMGDQLNQIRGDAADAKKTVDDDSTKLNGMINEVQVALCMMGIDLNHDCQQILHDNQGNITVPPQNQQASGPLVTITPTTAGPPSSP